MRTVRTIAEVRAALAGAGSVGLVPTMGAFHAGHISLFRAARAENDVVVVSLFVNPAQFDAADDLAAYPREEAHDVAIAEREGVDVLFAPSVEELYPRRLRRRGSTSRGSATGSRARSAPATSAASRPCA